MWSFVAKLNLHIAEEAKASLPDEFDKDWVMTVQQSKGLEFDDVLLYDFFSHSPAKDAWRVVTNYTESGEQCTLHLAQCQVTDNLYQSTKTSKTTMLM